MTRTLDPARVRNAKKAFVTRRIPREEIQTLISGPGAPMAGDLLLARVDEIGHHGRLENPEGRREHLYPGDEIIVAYGNRYAPDQFEAEVPQDLGPAHLVAAGGLVGLALSQHERIVRPTAVTPIGLLGDKFGRPLNLGDFSLGTPGGTRRLPVIAVVGASMNAGKTTMAASLVRGLSRAGETVGAAKVTGTGAGGDIWKMRDAGARVALDFTDAGFASTYKVGVSGLEEICRTLYRNLVSLDCSVLVLEVADGLCQPETAALLRSATFRNRVQGLLFAAGEAMSAAGAVARLKAEGHPVLGVGGRMTRAPLAIREVEATLDIPCYTSDQLQRPNVAAALWAAVTQRARAREASRLGSEAKRGRAGTEPVALNDSFGRIRLENFGGRRHCQVNPDRHLGMLRSPA